MFKRTKHLTVASALIGKYEDNLTALDYFGLKSSLPLHDWSYPKPDDVTNVIAIFEKDSITFKRLDRNSNSAFPF